MFGDGVARARSAPLIRRDSVSNRRLVRSSAIVAAGTAVSRLSGFVRVATIANALGLSAVAGVYSYSNETPNIVYELLLGGILTATLVPLFVHAFEHDDEDSTSAIVTVSLVGLAIATLLGIVLAPVIVHLYTLRVTGADRAMQQELATRLLRLFMPQMFFYGVTALGVALLQARRQFAAAAFAPVLNNLVVIGVFLVVAHNVATPPALASVLGDNGLVLLLGLGTTAGVVAMAGALLPAVHRSGVRIHFLASWRHAAVRQLLRLSGWSVGYVVVNQIALWVVLVLANGETGGAFAYLAAYAFFQLPHGLFSVSITTTVAPEMASAAARGDLRQLRSDFSLGLRMIAIAVLPASAVYLGLARPLVVALLQRGAFSAGDATIVADSLALFAIGIFAFSAYLLSLRVWYARHDTRTPFLLNCFENAVNVALAIPLFAWLGIPGLALAFAAAYTAAAIAALVWLRAMLDGLDGRRITSTVGRAAVAAALAGAVAWATGHIVGWDTRVEAWASVIVGGVLALGVAFGALVVLRVPELRELLDAMRRRTPDPPAEPDASVASIV
jgi:putative peptidoglycan lipid II flippase